jgi:DNA-binding winged helix-turn-helix (wHTH) protein/TolB-like protein
MGEWQVDPTVNALSRPGETVRLEPKTMEVLVFLAERAGQVVSRDVLLAALWPGVVVGEDAVTQTVIKLRKALHDPARSPQYIETISKRGYRLVAAVACPGVKAVPAPVSAGEDDPVVQAGKPIRRLLRTGGITALAGLLIVGGIAYQRWRQSADRLAIEMPLVGEVADRWVSLPTITVALFETLGGERDETYLAGGIRADLMTDLSRLSALRVVSAQNLPRVEAGRAASAAPAAPAPRYLLSGAVQRASESLRVNVWLTDSDTGQQLWAERYERPFRDLLTMQGDIIGHIVQVLPIQITAAERQRLSRRYTRNLEAYDLFLRAKAAFLVRQPAENQVAQAMYRKAIELDPAFARAYAGLALAHTDDYRNQWTTDGPGVLSRANDLAQTALRMDPELPEVYGVLGYVHAVRHQHDEAIKRLRQAITLAPSYADGYAYLGAIYTHIGRPADGIPLLRTAVRLNPDAGFIYYVVLGRAYLFLGDIEQASINLREALSRNPTDLEARVFMAATLVATGDLSAARWEALEVRALKPGFAARQWLQTHPMTNADQKQRLINLLAQVEL